MADDAAPEGEPGEEATEAADVESDAVEAADEDAAGRDRRRHGARRGRDVACSARH